MKKAYLFLILLFIVAPLGIVGIYYVSATSASFSVSSIGFSDIPTPIEALLTRQIDVDIYLEVTGHGIVSIPIKSISGQIYIENIYMGSVKSTEGFVIPSSGTRTIHIVFELDLSDISLSDVQQAVSSVTAHGGEVGLRFEGYVEPIVLFFPITVPISQTSYLLTASADPKVLSMNWAMSSAEIGEKCSFSVELQNPYRDSSLQGALKVIVREDVALGSDVDAGSYNYQIQLAPGKETEISGSFTVYKNPQTRGFFLKAVWGNNVIAEQSDSYPPRLKVVKGTLDIIDAYWTVDGSVVTSVEVGERVEAHVVVRAIDGNFRGYVKIQIRKDFALLPDVEYTYSTYDLYLPLGQSKEFTLIFAPDEASSLSLRGYFIEVEFDGESWTMESDYLPRLKAIKHEEKKGTLQVLDAYWKVSGSKVTSSKVGDEVEIWINVEAVGGPFDGSIMILVRKDRVGMTDITYKSFEDSLSLNEGEKIWLRARFTPDEASSTFFEGYFIELEFDGDSWTMENRYPPRLKVSEAEAPTEPGGTPQVIDAWWTVGGAEVTSANVGSNVVAHVVIKALDGRLDGAVRVRVRKDITMLPDEDYEVKTFDISVGTGQTIELKVSFSPDKASGLTLRGYFIQVDLITWDDTWTMSDSYPPRLKVS